jgi:hypothetical protein
MRRSIEGPKRRENLKTLGNRENGENKPEALNQNVFSVEAIPRCKQSQECQCCQP